MQHPHINRPVVIEAGRTEQQYWKDLWLYRELLYFLAWSELLVRYKQTIFGVAWSLLRPFLTIIIFTLIFDNLARLPSGNVPYPILVMAALLPWQFFASALNSCSFSLTANTNLISKVYFPRLIIPASAVIVSLVDFVISGLILAGLILWFSFGVSWNILLLPLFLALAFGAALGAGLWMAALNVKYRDFHYIVPFLIQFGLYISPVGFSSNLIGEQWRLLYSFNPLVGIIDGFRWAILGSATPLYWPSFILSGAITLLLLSSGIWYFRKAERTFADII